MGSTIVPLGSATVASGAPDNLTRASGIVTPSHLGSFEGVQAKVQATLDEPISFVAWVERLKFKVAYLPLGPTQAHIDGMKKERKLDAKNVFVGEEAWEGAVINSAVPQVFGYTIQNDEELALIITDPTVLANARKEQETSGVFPTIYVLNHQARLSHAEHIGGTLATHEQQLVFWKKLLWATVLKKATSAGIPFMGCFHADIRKFRHIGHWSVLVSSSKYEAGSSAGLGLDRYDWEMVVCWSRPEYGHSSLVVFG